jgi:hypothetical protein
MEIRMRYRGSRSKRERSALVDEAEVQETLYKATIRQKEARGKGKRSSSITPPPPT